MKVVGVLALGVVGLLALIGVLVGIRSIPEARRYARIRSM